MCPKRNTLCYTLCNVKNCYREIVLYKIFSVNKTKLHPSVPDRRQGKISYRGRQISKLRFADHAASETELTSKGRQQVKGKSISHGY